MHRFRVTLLAVCLLLVFLGGIDLRTVLRNPRPLRTTVSELERSAPGREWLSVEGYVDLLQAISTSGTVEVEAFLVPLKSSPGARSYRVLVETRDPAIVEALKTYHFGLDSELERSRFVEERRELFSGRRDVTGMLTSTLTGTGNRDRLRTLAKDYGEKVPDEPVLITEGLEPARLRGFFLAGVGLLGVIKVLSGWKKKAGPVTRPGGAAP
ncbi:MAG: hypothetical protein A2V77_14150 [Anaeromyxobacter sp. RBG_16_69_14]|nr:MAG: hypothetical protein A2V77_14150 [Anaeromyxobacter sp. RBG_16_69_14]